MQHTNQPTIRGRPIAALRYEWEQRHGTPVPRSLGKDLLTRALAWKEQERSRGGISRPSQRDLTRLIAQLDRSGDLDLERQPRLKAGTRLVREWHGNTYHVTVLNDGYLFQERHYSSLSAIAQMITGVKWSGPRFFGLRPRVLRAQQGAASDA